MSAITKWHLNIIYIRMHLVSIKIIRWDATFI